MNKARLLRLLIWLSVALVVLFQVAFLLELHSPLPSDVVLWSASILSVACIAVVLLARRSLAVHAKISYTPERLYPPHRFDVGAEYGVQGVYCVILRRRPLRYLRTKRFYLSEASADRAVATASIENPQWRAIGVEPSNLCARMSQNDRSRSTSHTWHVA
jgi:hypothetical protein